MTQVEPDVLLDAIRAIVRDVPGLRNVPGGVPDNISTWPAAPVYYTGGEYATGNFGIRDGLFSIAVDVMMPRKDLVKAMATLEPFIKSIPTALMEDPTFGNLSEPPSGIRVDLFNNVYAETEVIGYRFLIKNVQVFPYGKQ